MSDRQDLNYCTYCGGDIPLQYTMDVSIETKVKVDKETLGYISDNYSLCSYRCLHKVISERTDLRNTTDKVKTFRHDISDNKYRITSITEENGGDDHE